MYLIDNGVSKPLITFDSSTIQQLINNLDRDLQYAIQVEGKTDLELVSNYSDVKNAIMEKVARISF